MDSKCPETAISEMLYLFGAIALLYPPPPIIIDDSSWKNAAESFAIALTLTLGGYESAIAPFFSWLHKPREEQVQLLYLSYQVNFFKKKDLGVNNSNNFDVEEFLTLSPKMLVFWILLKSKSHSKQFSQVGRSALAIMVS